ncbi:putative transcriptional regulator tpeD [Wolffia australiana]
MKIQFAQELNSIDHISLTVDTWTTENNIELLGVTVHWIYIEWKMRNWVLSIRDIELPEGHSGKKMSDIVMVVLEEFNLIVKVTIITTDNTSCNGTMITLLAEGIVDMNPGFTHAWQISGIRVVLSRSMDRWNHREDT